MADERADWARTEYICVCGAKFQRQVREQRRCEKCEDPKARERALAIYKRAVQAFCEVLTAEIHEEEARTFADSTNSETGLFICEDGTGVGFVFHSFFGALLTAEQVKAIEEAQSDPNRKIRMHVKQLLTGAIEQSAEDPLTREEREGR